MSGCWPGSPPCFFSADYGYIAMYPGVGPALACALVVSAVMVVWVGTWVMCSGVGLALFLASSVWTMGMQRCVWVLARLPLYLVLFGDSVEGQRGNLPGCWQRRKAIAQISAKSFLILVMFTHTLFR